MPAFDEKFYEEASELYRLRKLFSWQLASDAQEHTPVHMHMLENQFSIYSHAKFWLREK